MFSVHFVISLQTTVTKTFKDDNNKSPNQHQNPSSISADSEKTTETAAASMELPTLATTTISQEKDIHPTQVFVKTEIASCLKHINVYCIFSFFTQIKPILIIVSPERSSERDYVITDSVRSMYM